MFSVNRSLRNSIQAYSYLASGLVGLALAAELPARFTGVGWLALAVILLELALRKRLAEFRFQSYSFAIAGAGLITYRHVFERWEHPAIPLLCGLALAYAVVLRLRFVPASVLGKVERQWLDMAGAGAITVLSFLPAWQVAPQGYRGLSLCAVALLLLQLGLRELPASLIPFSYGAYLVAACSVVMEAFPRFGRSAPSAVWISYGGAACSAYLLAFRTTVAIQQTPVAQRNLIRVLASSIGTVFALITLWIVLPEMAVAPVWSAFALGLFFLGLRYGLADLRGQGYPVMSAAAFRAWVFNLHASTAKDLSAGIWTAALVVIACYLAQWYSPAAEKDRPENFWSYLDGKSRIYWSLVGTALLTILLSYQFPGGLLTISWGAEGLILLSAGFPLRERVLRLQGLVVFGICITKLFFYDLQNLETLYRILSFIGLGLLLLTVSWIYTRFREHINRYL